MLIDYLVEGSLYIVHKLMLWAALCWKDELMAMGFGKKAKNIKILEEIKAVKMLKANPAYYFVQFVSANVFTKGSGKILIVMRSSGK